MSSTESKTDHRERGDVRVLTIRLTLLSLTQRFRHIQEHIRSLQPPIWGLTSVQDRDWVGQGGIRKRTKNRNEQGCCRIDMHAKAWTWTEQWTMDSEKTQEVAGGWFESTDRYIQSTIASRRARRDIRPNDPDADHARRISPV